MPRRRHGRPARRRCPTTRRELAALNRTYVNVVELTVRAVLEERPEHVRHAAMLDPNTAATLTLDEIDALCDELTAAHGDAAPGGAARRAATSEVGARRERDPPRRGHEDLPERRPGRRRRRARDRRGRVRRARRPVRLRQVDAAADDRRPRGRHRRRRSRSATSTSPTSRRSSATSRWSSRTTRSTRT